MKILVISNLYPPDIYGGCEILCNQVCEGFEKKGHQISVLTSIPSREEFWQKGKDNHILRRLKLTMPFEQPPSEINFWHKRKTFRRNFAETRQCIQQLKPDLIFVWSQLRLTMGAVRAALDCALPIAFTFNDESIAGYLPRRSLFEPGRLSRYISTDLLSPDNSIQNIHFSHATCISNTLKSNLVAKGVPLQNSKVIYQGIPLEQFVLKPEPGALGSPVKILYTGSLLAQKGVHTIIDAVHQVAHRLGKEKLVLTVVGEGPEDYVQMLQARASSGSARIEFSGRIPYAEIAAIYRQHDILVFASNSVEAFGLTPLEAMASGTTLVSTDRGGHGEMLKDRNNALIFQEEDVGQLASRIELLIKNPALSRELAKSARATVEQHFSIDRYVRDLEHFLLDAQKITATESLHLTV